MTTRTFESYTGMVNVRDYGAVGDGVADDTQAIQDALDHAMENDLNIVWMPPGVYRTTDTIHVGYGYSFMTIGLHGTVRASQIEGPVAEILPDFQDRAVISIQGVRTGGIANIYIHGPVDIGGVSAHVDGPVFAADPDNYIPAGAQATNDHSPYCAVVIDGYSESLPADPFPLPTLPAFLGGGAMTYDRLTSSDAYVRECVLWSTNIGILLQPNSDTNGDFCDFSRTQFVRQRIGVSIGNVNARSNDFSNTQFAACHTCIEGMEHASVNGGGNIAGNHNNVHVVACYRLYHFSTNHTIAFTVNNFYCESLQILGSWVGTGTGNGFPVFVGCSIELTDYKITGSAVSEIYSSASVCSTATFIGCTIQGNRSCFVFPGGCYFEDCNIVPYGAVASSTGTILDVSDEEGNAVWGAFGGAFINRNSFTEVTAFPRFKNCHMIGSDFLGSYYDGYDGFHSSNYHSVGICNGSGQVPYIIPNYARQDDNYSSFSNRVMTDRGWTSSQADQGTVGDVILHDLAAAPTWLYLESITGSGPYIQNWVALNNFQYAQNDGDPSNLFTNSEESFGEPWELIAGNPILNTTVDPRGDTRADTWANDSSLGVYITNENNPSTLSAAGVTLTYSREVKPGVTTNFEMAIYGFDTGFYTDGVEARFTLAGAGTVTTTINRGAGVVSAATITSIANGFYRCTVSGVVNSTATQVFTDCGTFLAGVELDIAFYLGGAQIEEASSASAYHDQTPTYSLLPEALLDVVGQSVYHYPIGVIWDDGSSNKFWVTVAGSAVVECVDSSGVTTTIPAGLTTASRPFFVGNGNARIQNRFLPFQVKTTVSSVGANNMTMSHVAQTSGVYYVCSGITRNLLFL